MAIAIFAVSVELRVTFAFARLKRPFFVMAFMPLQTNLFTVADKTRLAGENIAARLVTGVDGGGFSALRSLAVESATTKFS